MPTGLIVAVLRALVQADLFGMAGKPIDVSRKWIARRLLFLQ